MRAFRISLALAGLTATSAFAQPPTGPFSELPPSHPVYATLHRWEGVLFTGYPQGTFDGSRRLTRYEVAVAVQRMTSEIERIGRGLIGPSRQDPSRLGPTGELFAAAVQGEGWPVRAPAGTLSRQLTGLHTLILELRPELEMLGSDVGAIATSLTRLVRETARLPVGVPEGRKEARRFDPEELRILMTGSPVEQARSGLALLIREVEDPAATQFWHGLGGSWTRSHNDYMTRIIEAIVGSGADVATLRAAREQTGAGELRDGLDLTLGLLGDPSAARSIHAYAVDWQNPLPLRELAIRALGVIADPGSLAPLASLAERDPVWRRLSTGCISSGPPLMEYPARDAAVRVLRDLKERRGFPRELIEKVVERAVLKEPLFVRDRNPQAPGTE